MRNCLSALVLALLALPAAAQAPAEPKRTQIPSWIPELRTDPQRYVPAPERSTAPQRGDAPRVMVISPEGCTEARCSERRFDPPRTIEFETPSILPSSESDRVR